MNYIKNYSLGYDVLQSVLDEKLKYLASLKAELSRLPRESLYIELNKCGGNPRFRLRSKEGIFRLNKDDRLTVHKYARSKYLQYQIELLEAECRCLEKLLSDSNVIATRTKMEAFAHKCEAARLNMRHIKYSARTNKRLDDAIASSKRPMFEDGLKFPTKAGIIMRSKSEATIGNILEDYGIQYVYEPMMLIGEHKVRPDFLAVKPNGEQVAMEHLGLMTDVAYRDRAALKMLEYDRGGFILGYNLIFTFEDDISHPERIHKLIQNIILR